MSANADRIAARMIDSAANVISGLELSEINLNGHAVANELWRISSYLRKRATAKESK